MTTVFEQEQVVHVRFEGQSWSFPAADLGVRGQSTDDEVRRALASRLDVAAARLAPYVVERHANGNITVRPEAVFG